MNRTVCFNPALNPRPAEGRPIDAVARTDLYIIINLNDANLWDFVAASAIRDKTITITADDRTRMNRYPVFDPATVHKGYIGLNHRLISDAHPVPVENAILNRDSERIPRRLRRG